jgi:hypothetical protein
LDFEGQLVAIFYADFSQEKENKWRWMTSLNRKPSKNDSDQ